MDQNQISKYISDELQVPQILLWCSEIDVLVSTGFLEQLQAAPRVQSAGTDLPTHDGLQEAVSRVHTLPTPQGAHIPTVKSTHSSLFSHQG